MSSEIAIKVEGLSKCYQIYEHPRDRLKQFVLPKLKNLLGKPGHNYYKEFWALNNVSFEVRKGETVGIIGRNGSGKSTLLQLICGTLNPTSGSITTNGRIAALLELGSGFNPEFTGRENVYMSCALLGLSQQEVESKFDDIAAFADIGDHLDQPVKTYSSGMFVRLAFAVNVISSPDIMVVDEALAVGDMNFQAKCMTALTRFQERGGTVLFVSHDVGSIKSLCRQAVYLERGQVLLAGPGPEVAERYVRNMREEMNQESLISYANQSLPECQTDEASHKTTNVQTSTQKKSGGILIPLKKYKEFDDKFKHSRYGIGGAVIKLVELLDDQGRPGKFFDFNQEVEVKIYFKSNIDIELSVNYYIQDDKKILVIGAGLKLIGHELINCKENCQYVASYRTKLPLQEGIYSIQVQLSRPVIENQTADFIDVIDDAVVFSVGRKSSGRVWTKVFLDNTFELEQL